MVGIGLFPNDFPVNTLTHLCTNDFNFAHIAALENQRITKIYVFHSGPKIAKVLNKAKDDKISRFVACQIMGG